MDSSTIGEPGLGPRHATREHQRLFLGRNAIDVMDDDARRVPNTLCDKM
jgi:hypothetical protein